MAKVVEKKAAETNGKRQPDFIIRSRERPDTDRWITVGAAWTANINGKTGYSVKINSLPVEFDGSLLMLPPLETEE